MVKAKDSSYPVGYKKPPRRTQFQPGQSGNPNGRPQKTVTFQDALRELLAPVTLLQEDGRQKKVSGLVIMLGQLVNNAARGDFKSAKWVSQLAQQLNTLGKAALRRI